MSSKKLNESAKQVGERIKARRLALGLSQKQLAEAIGFTAPTTIKNYEKGQTPRGQVLTNLTTVLGVSADWLLHGGSADLIRESNQTYVKAQIIFATKEDKLRKQLTAVLSRCERELAAARAQIDEMLTPESAQDLRLYDAASEAAADVSPEREETSGNTEGNAGQKAVDLDTQNRYPRSAIKAQKRQK